MSSAQDVNRGIRSQSVGEQIAMFEQQGMISPGATRLCRSQSVGQAPEAAIDSKTASQAKKIGSDVFSRSRSPSLSPALHSSPSIGPSSPGKGLDMGELKGRIGQLRKEEGSADGATRETRSSSTGSTSSTCSKMRIDPVQERITDFIAGEEKFQNQMQQGLDFWKQQPQDPTAAECVTNYTNLIAGSICVIDFWEKLLGSYHEGTLTHSLFNNRINDFYTGQEYHDYALICNDFYELQREYVEKGIKLPTGDLDFALSPQRFLRHSLGIKELEEDLIKADDKAQKRTVTTPIEERLVAFSIIKGQSLKINNYEKNFESALQELLVTGAGNTQIQLKLWAYTRGISYRMRTKIKRIIDGFTEGLFAEVTRLSKEQPGEELQAQIRNKVAIVGLLVDLKKGLKITE
jgi:hypothetical protein